MFIHLLKIMWNKRRANAMIFLEILLAFVVLFGVYTFASFNWERYRSPLGFDTEDALLVGVNLNDDLDSSVAVNLQARLRRELIAIEGVNEAAFIGSIPPFSNNTWQTGTDANGFEIFYKMFFADENLPAVAGLKVTDGRWYDEADRTAKYSPIVVNQAFIDKYYPDAPTMVDSLIITDGTTRIVGVVEDFKYYSNFAEREPIIFFSKLVFDGEIQHFQMLWLRTEPGRKADVQEAVYRTAVDLTKDTDVTIADLAELRTIANRPTLLPLTILTLISSFLLINIALGLFGVLFTQINRRRAEIGLRKAMGATPGEITAQFVGEILVVTVAGLLLGTFFAMQIPLLELLPIPAKFFYFGIGAAILTILLIVILCALIPSRQAAGLHPAHVLHEE